MLDREAVESAAAAGVKKALEEHHLCRFRTCNPEDVSHAIGMFKDLGEGDISAGIEVVRDNHKWIMRWATRIDKLSDAIAKTIVSIIVAAVLGLIWLGLKAKGQ